jgi:hypothetical protein
VNPVSLGAIVTITWPPLLAKPLVMRSLELPLNPLSRSQ